MHAKILGIFQSLPCSLLTLTPPTRQGHPGSRSTHLRKTVAFQLSSSHDNKQTRRRSLLVEILIRSFPDPGSACRSKSVCKHWRSLISDPCFCRRFLSHHQSKSNNTTSLINHPLLLSADSLLTFLPMPPDRAPGRVDFAAIDCFKDLLLCGFGSHSGPERARSYLLCNPFTKQWVALPLAPERPAGIRALSARLVCDDEPLIISDRGRFRVVCIYQDAKSMKLDVFCSESGEWTKEALVLQGRLKCERQDVVSCNGVLYVPYIGPIGFKKPLIAGFDPFRLDIPPVTIHTYPIVWNDFWNISISQDALHLIVHKFNKPAGALTALSVWGLDDEFWTEVCQGPVKPSSSSPSMDDYRLILFNLPTLHPEKSEIAFLTYSNGDGGCHAPCDLGKEGELEFVAKETLIYNDWRVFQPRVYCWPTRIPRYKSYELCTMEATTAGFKAPNQQLNNKSTGDECKKEKDESWKEKQNLEFWFN